MEKIFRKIRKWFLKRYLSKIYKNFQLSREGQWIISLDDTCRLYDLVRRKSQEKNAQAVKILELGGGIGAATAVLAQALHNNHQSVEGGIVTVEQFEKCINIARSLIPKYLLPYIEFIHSATEVFEYKAVPYRYFTAYKNLPLSKNKNYDVLVIDGPSYWLENEKLVDPADVPNGDFIRILPHLNAGAFVYIDGRRRTVKTIHRFFYKFLKPIEESDDYSILIRTDVEFNETLVIDKQIEELKQQGYF